MNSKDSALEYGLEISTRLFDHRPFLRSELRTFVKNFDDKLPDQQLPTLSDTACRLRRTADITLPQCSDQLPTRLALLQDRLDVLSDRIQAGLSSLDATERLLTEERSSVVVRQQQDWQQYLDNLLERKLKFDDEFDQKERKLREHFQQQHI